MTNRMEQVDPRRSALMSRIHGKDTKPEMAVRRIAHVMGFRFRLHRRDLPGRPDLVFPRHQPALFVHGCFWHQHAGCRLASRPKSREHYWLPKLASNVARDARSMVALEALGWRVAVLWECETRNSRTVRSFLQTVLPQAGQ